MGNSIFSFGFARISEVRHIFKEETYAYFAELARHTRSKTHSLLGRGCPCGGMLVLVAHHCLQNVGH